MLQFLVHPQVMLSSQLLAITVWDTCRLLSLPKAARLIGGLAAAEIIVGYLGIHIPLVSWRDTSFTLMGGLWTGAILAGLVGYMLQLRWIEAQRKNVLLDRHRQSMTSLAKTIIDLQDYAVQAEDFAIRKQREYVAREIHDSIGHTLTCLIVQLGAYGKTYAGQPELVADLETARLMACKGLEDARAVVDTFRIPLKERPRGRDAWIRLIQAFTEVTRMEARIDISELFEEIPQEIDQVVYRIIQEALTNAYRHGQASVVDTAIWWEEATFYIRISDNGHGVFAVEEGHGLQGMRERLSPLGGSLAHRSVPERGFDLGVEIPWERSDVDEQPQSVDRG